MANFIAVVDGDVERRQRFLKRVWAEISPVDSLRIDAVEAGEFASVWAAQDRAPISSTCSSGSAAVIWGDAIPGPGPERLHAAELLRAWDPAESAPPPPYNGFYAALRYDERQGLTLGADLLGFFPVYYAASAGTLVLGTSPELFRHHPCFPARLGAEGLAGILLTHGLLEGRTLVRGVYRLRPGHVLTWRPGADPVEVLQYSVPDSPRVNGGSFASDVDQLDSALAAAIRRHVSPDGTYGLLLSGGRDSRLLAGYLRDRSDRLHALTLGSATDYEMMCAKAVGRVLGCAHLMTDLDETQLPAAAELQAKWEHLGSGFSTIRMWGAIAPLRELPQHFVSGYNLESRGREAIPFAFDELVSSGKIHGIQAATLRRLLRPDVFYGVVDRVEQRLRALYEADSAIGPWRFFLAHDWRFHAGGIPWRLSFGSWPILPILDREVIEVIATLPASTLANRRAQDEILRRRFPDLARLPLDRNSHDTLPLLPSAGRRIRHRIGRALEPIRWHIPRRRERRYYHRMYDINSVGWRAVRRLAEPHRERLADIVSMAALAELVPPPDTHIAVENKIRDSYGTKQLLGLMLWSASHL